ncbi:DUF6520 family protein [Pedobacter sp. KLB.chiD]|uniref:DUF6520 family protein n=1 Tax=Pedobacter sp. KLB.chiD TaxID=3387402 RepID=UPI00399B0E86
MKRMIIPVAIVLMGAGAAFATKAAKNAQVNVDAYRIDGAGQCVFADQQCSTSGTEACTWAGDNSTPLSDAPISATMCGDPLFKVQ